MTTQPDLLPDASIDPNGLLGADLDSVPRAKWPATLVEAIEVQEAAFERLGYGHDEAWRLAKTAVLALAQYWGGRYRYLPRGDDLVTALRDAEIFRRARRGNIEQLASEYGISDRQIWRICHRQHALHHRKLQGNLFDDLGDEP